MPTAFSLTDMCLSLQIKSHLCAVLTHTDITVAVVMGGVAPQKQERLLRQGPDIVVGTPGRLWELIQQGNEHLSQTSSVKLVSDIFQTKAIIAIRLE